MPRHRRKLALLAATASASALCLLASGCASKRSTRGGEARCKTVKQGQPYAEVKAAFGRVEDERRGSDLLHVYTWRFGKARCEVRFSGVAVSRDAQWLTGPRRPGPRRHHASVDCAALVTRQQACLDALVRDGVNRATAGLARRIDQTPAGSREAKRQALRRTQKQLGAFMRKELVAYDEARCQRETRHASPARAGVTSLPHAKRVRDVRHVLLEDHGRHEGRTPSVGCRSCRSSGGCPQEG